MATRLTTLLVGACLMGACAPPPADPDAMPASYREVQVRQLEAQRNLLVSMIDSMPADLFRDRATESQRDFAGQIWHAAGAVTGIAGGMVLEVEVPLSRDTTETLASPDALRAWVNQAYDWSIEQLRGQSDASRMEMMDFFGQEIPRWQAWDEIHQHTLWTAGQIVANFRKHGMAPPPFAFF